MSGGGDALFGGPYSGPDHFSSGFYPAPPPFSPPRMANSNNPGSAHGFQGLDLNNPYNASSAASTHRGMAGPSQGNAGYGGTFSTSTCHAGFAGPSHGYGGTMSAARPFGGMAGPSHGYGGPMSAATPLGGMAAASHAYSGYGGPPGFFQMPVQGGGQHMFQPPRHSTSSMSVFGRGGPQESAPPNQLPPMLPSYEPYGEGSSYGCRVPRSHGSPSRHPRPRGDDEMSSAAPCRQRSLRAHSGFMDAGGASSDYSMPSMHGGNNSATVAGRVKWDDNLTQALCQLWLDQYHLGNVANGKLTPGGWSNLVAAFKDTTGRPYSKGQLDYQIRQLRKVFTAVRKLECGSGGDRNERGGFIASDNAWNEIKGCPDVERLKFEEPPWLKLLYTMFKDIHFDVDVMLKAATKEPSSQNMDSQGTPAGGSNTTGTTSGSRKRGRSGAAKSTAESPAKPPAQPSSPASTLQPKAKKNFSRLWGGVVG